MASDSSAISDPPSAIQPSAISRVPRPVWLLGWVSLATDAASEAIYSLLPFFLTQVLGATAVSLGIVEGAAEAVNSALKIVSGRLADRTSRKRRIVLLGYSVSSAIRPLIAFTTTWTQVFAVRVVDRVGKGVRGAPRDAMLAAWATSSTRGRVFGLQRGMDHIGAVVGPALATLFLVFYPGQYRTLFLWTIVPGAVAVGLILLLPAEDQPTRTPTDESDSRRAENAARDVPLPRRAPRAGLDGDVAEPPRLVQRVALEAATYQAARFLRAENRIGSIQKGREANLVLVDGNPLQDISLSERISTVIYRGERVRRANLFEQ